MYTSLRYSRHSSNPGNQNYGSSPNRHNGQSHSPSKYGMMQQPQQQSQYGNGNYDAPCSPPTKAHSYHPVYSNGFSNSNNSNNGETMYFEQNQYYPHQNQQHSVDGHYYYSSSSVSSSQDGGYYMDEMDDVDNVVDPDMTTIPTVPTPIGLSKYEHGKTPSGRVLVTSGNQTVEFFSCVVNAPRELYAAE